MNIVLSCRQMEGWMQGRNRAGKEGGRERGKKGGKEENRLEESFSVLMPNHS